MSKNTQRIHRHNYESHFTILPNALWEHEYLSFGAKALMGYLLSRPKNWVVRRPQLSQIYKGDKTGNGEYAVDGWFKELIKFGYIIYTPRCPETGKFIHRYDVYPEPQEEIKEKIPQGVKPPMVIPPDGQTSHITRKETPTRTEFDKDTYKETPKPEEKPDVRVSAMPSSKEDNCYVLDMAKKFGLKDSQLDTVAFLCSTEGLGSKAETICWWAKQYSFSRIQEVVRYAKSKGIDNIGGYVNSLLKSGAVINEAKILENTELANFYKNEMKKNIEVMKKYVKINHSNGYVEEVPLTIDVNSFSQMLNTKLGGLFNE